MSGSNSRIKYVVRDNGGTVVAVIHEDSSVITLSTFEVNMRRINSMRNIEVKEDGSFWQIATFFGVNDLPKDGCSLFWGLLFHSVVIIGLCLLAGAFFGELFANLLFNAVNTTWVWGISVIILTGVVSVFGTLAIVFTPFVIVSKAKQDSDNKVMKTIYNCKTLYKGFKGKFCPLVREV